MEKFLKFGLVGIFNTLITIISYNLLVKIGMNYLVANSIGYMIGVANSYYWNKNWVFRSKDNNKSLFLKFLAVNLIVFAFNTISLYLLVDKLLMNPFISQIFAIGIGMIMNFFLNKFWTFNK